MTGPTYPAARSVAERIQSRLATCGGQACASKIIEEVVTAAFWASLRREEGRAPTISIAFVAPEHVSRPLTFAARLPLDADVLVKLAPAVERPGIHLGVWPDQDDQLRVWGTTRAVPTSCFVLEVIEPGLLVVKFRRTDPATKFENAAVLEGAKVKFITQQDRIITEAPKALRSLLTFYSSAGREESDHILVRLAISMRAHRRGGSLLVVPGDNEDWQSIVKPISYSVIPPFSEIDGLSSDSDSLRSAIDALAGWTAVDGATVISDHFALIASGVKIVSRDASKRVNQVMVTEPVEGAAPAVVEPAQLGNTRHLSAAQFVYDQRDSIALVASQDGRFTVFAWSPSANLVRAHRMETLLL